MLLHCPVYIYSSFLLVLSHTFVWVPGAKSTGPKIFLKSNFYVGKNFKFQCDPFSNKKMFHKGPVAANKKMGPVRNGIFYF
jgi:hypothetical protein